MQLLLFGAPLLQDPIIRKETELLIGAIAQRLHDNTRARDETRWKTILQLVPSMTPVDSAAVLGLARTALLIQCRWRNHGQQCGSGFAAVSLMRDRFKAFLPDVAIDEFAVFVSTSDEPDFDEPRIVQDRDRLRNAKDCAPDNAASRRFKRPGTRVARVPRAKPQEVVPGNDDVLPWDARKTSQK